MKKYAENLEWRNSVLHIKNAIEFYLFGPVNAMLCILLVVQFLLYFGFFGFHGCSWPNSFGFNKYIYTDFIKICIIFLRANNLLNQEIEKKNTINNLLCLFKIIIISILFPMDIIHRASRNDFSIIAIFWVIRISFCDKIFVMPLNLYRAKDFETKLLHVQVAWE